MQKNQAAVALLEDIQNLMELQGENPFKVRAYEKAARAIESVDDLERRARLGTLTDIPGVGKGIAETLREFLVEGKSSILEALSRELPPGLLELTQVPGLGPKKASTLIQKLDIHSVSELEYACRENRLLNLKGFGEKAQKKILDGVVFLNSTRGQVRRDQAEELARSVEAQLRAWTETRVERTGALRRQLEVLDGLDFLVELPEDPKKATQLIKACEAQPWSPSSVAVRIHFTGTGEFEWNWAKTTATPKHWNAMAIHPTMVEPRADEQTLYRVVGLDWVAPELREGDEVMAWAKQPGALGEIIRAEQIQGAFHCHTTASDGAASLEAMVVEACRLGYRYLGISDHSVSAHYAQGLDEGALKKQEREVREVQEKYPDIRIFWGIESDILADGSLDYPESILKRFDFVIASIHSRFGMKRDEMTQRILKAIQNPYTRFVGHLTGRLLLGRRPYELDLEKIIHEARIHDVAIEINAHPARLDIDWRCGPLLREHGTLVSINPDAHDLEGLQHIRYGVTVARKALLPAWQVLNSLSADRVEKWLSRTATG